VCVKCADCGASKEPGFLEKWACGTVLGLDGERVQSWACRKITALQSELEQAKATIAKLQEK